MNVWMRCWCKFIFSCDSFYYNKKSTEQTAWKYLLVYQAQKFHVFTKDLHNVYWSVSICIAYREYSLQFDIDWLAERYNTQVWLGYTNITSYHRSSVTEKSINQSISILLAAGNNENNYVLLSAIHIYHHIMVFKLNPIECYSNIFIWNSWGDNNEFSLIEWNFIMFKRKINDIFWLVTFKVDIW